MLDIVWPIFFLGKTDKIVSYM